MGKNRRTKISYNRWEFLLEAVSAAAVVAGGALLIYYWPQLPELVPRHYDFQGTVDAWGGKGIVAALPLLNLLLYLLLTLTRIFGPVLSKEGSSPRALILAMEMLAWIKAATAVTFSYLTWATVAIALGRAEGLAPIAMPLFISITLGATAIYCFRIFRDQQAGG